jgi:hypothetical protein
VDDLCLGEQAAEHLRLANVVGAHLDEPRLALLLGQRPEEIEVETPACRDRIRVIRRLEAPEGIVEGRAVHERVEAPRLIVDPDPMPPEVTQLVHEAAKRDSALEQVGQAAFVAVKARLDRHVGKGGMLPQEAAHDVGSAAAGAADEDERARVSVV